MLTTLQRQRDYTHYTQNSDVSELCVNAGGGDPCFGIGHRPARPRLSADHLWGLRGGLSWSRRGSARKVPSSAGSNAASFGVRWTAVSVWTAAQILSRLANRRIYGTRKGRAKTGSLMRPPSAAPEDFRGRWPPLVVSLACSDASVPWQVKVYLFRAERTVSIVSREVVGVDALA